LFLPLRQNFFYTVEYRNWKQVQTGYGALTREMEKEIKQLSQVCELWENGVIVESVDGTILSWNKGARTSTAIPLLRSSGKNTLSWCPAMSMTIFLSILKRINQGAPVARYDTIHLRKDYSRMTVSLTIPRSRRKTATLLPSPFLSTTPPTRLRKRIIYRFDPEFAHRHLHRQ